MDVGDGAAGTEEVQCSTVVGPVQPPAASCPSTATDPEAPKHAPPAASPPIEDAAPYQQSPNLITGHHK